MIDVEFDDDGMPYFNDTIVYKGSNLLTTQEGTLYYNQTFGIDLKRFISRRRPVRRGRGRPQARPDAASDTWQGYGRPAGRGRKAPDPAPTGVTRAGCALRGR